MLHRFERPQSIAEAARLLASGSWAVLAGGTDLYPAHVGRQIPAPLLDITAIAGLRGIHRDDRGWTIGATTTWTDVVRADLPPLFAALKAAAREVGGVQIQNAGTVAGNLCNASPAADGVPPLLALDAEVELASLVGTRRISLADFLVGSRRTALRPDEILTAVPEIYRKHDPDLYKATIECNFAGLSRDGRGTLGGADRTPCKPSSTESRAASSGCGPPPWTRS